MLLFGNIKNDARVNRTINTLSSLFNINLFCKDCSSIVKNVNLHFYHNRYSNWDLNKFERNSIFPIKSFFKIIYYIETEIIKIKSISKIRTDIYYCNDFNTLISGYFASKRNKAKLIYDSHELWAERSNARNTTFNKIKRIIEYFIEWFIIKRCNLVITVSDGIANELSERYKMKKPLIIRNLDEEKPLPSFEERMEIRDKLNISQDCILIVYQGSLQKNRGIPELIEAMDHLPDNTHLLLMGNFLSSSDLKSIKKNNRIHFPGMIPQEELFNYTACADIGIDQRHCENILNYELAFPNKFSQYMNAGLALALYDITESRKIIEQYDCGVVFEPGSSKNIINAINNIINSGKIDYYKRNSRKGFLEEYNWETEKQKSKEIMRKL